VAAPTYVTAGTGATDAGGTWSYTCAAPGASGRLIIVHVLQDGTTADAVAVTAGTNITSIEGTSNTWTKMNLGSLPGGDSPVGSPTLARHEVYFGRSTGTSAPTISGTNSTSEDLYIRSYEFQNANTGATLAAVIEGDSDDFATSGTIADCGVTTTGADRLAVNLIGISDDNAFAAFTGQTGGTWAEPVAEYAESSGTDATIAIVTAAMASAGTINGGTATNSDATDGWGVIGFAIIGTTAAGTSANAGVATGTGTADF
jgi:hypothetical protein